MPTESAGLLTLAGFLLKAEARTTNSRLQAQNVKHAGTLTSWSSLVQQSSTRNHTRVGRVTVSVFGSNCYVVSMFSESNSFYAFLSRIEICHQKKT